MNAHVITRQGSNVTLELRGTKTMTTLDELTLVYLKELAQAGTSMRCHLTLLDGQLVLRLSTPTLEAL